MYRPESSSEARLQGVTEAWGSPMKFAANLEHAPSEQKPTSLPNKPRDVTLVS